MSDWEVKLGVKRRGFVYAVGETVLMVFVCAACAAITCMWLSGHWIVP